MKDYKKDFADFNNQIWLNAASEGPIPKVAIAALQKAVEWKSLPYKLDIPKFISIPKELKSSLAQLIDSDAKDIILGNSASYGLHILANGLSWKNGDEILVMQNDFPTNILPWLGLAKQGVKVRQIAPANQVLKPEELEQNVSQKVKLFCISHVHTFSGLLTNIFQFAEICKKHKIIFVLNVSQSLGSIPFSLKELPVDVVVGAGYKWLLGPYGTGFCWIKPELREQLVLNQYYWSSVLSEEDLSHEGPLHLRHTNSARRFDIFGTANFFNFVPWKASIDYLLNIGIKGVRAYHDQLISQFFKSLDKKKYDVLSAEKLSQRSSLVVISHKNKKRNLEIFNELKRNNIYGAFWKGRIRFSPHLYNTSSDLTKTTDLLNALG